MRIFVSFIFGIVGLCYSAYLYPIEILNPYFYSWLHSDPVLHFISFNFFNTEPWHWPPGLIKNISFPELTSIVYADALPIVSLILKTFSVKGLFQFHGAWIYLCFFLQGALGYFLLSSFTNKKLNCFVGTIFLITFPSLIKRGYGSTCHYSLLCHCVILVAIGLTFHEKYKKNYLLWFVLIGITLGIHFYLASLVAMFLIASQEANLKNLILKAPVRNYIMMGLGWIILAYFYGYFSLPLRYSTGPGFGLYSMNLSSPFSIGYTATAHQDEGFQFLGWGTLLLAVVYVRKSMWMTLSSSIQLLILFLTFLSLSFQISFNTWVTPAWIGALLFSFLFFQFLRNKSFGISSSIFLSIGLVILLYVAGKPLRSSGRLFWGVSYLFHF